MGVYGNSLFQPEYELIKKGFENRLQKEEILDIFQKNPRDLSEAVEKYQGLRVGDITAEFYENCELIPDPKCLDPKLKNLLILNDCYLLKLKVITLEVDTAAVIASIFRKIIL